MSRVRQAEPDVRPLGAIAVGLSVIALLCALSYFGSPFAYLFAALGLPLGLVCRRDERTRRLGTAAVALSAAALALASVVILSLTAWQ